MKFRKRMYLAGLLALLSSSQVAQADTIVAEPASLLAQNQTRAGQFSVSLEDGRAKLSLSADNLVFAEVNAKVWTSEDQADLEELHLERDENGQFVAFVTPKKDAGLQEFKLELTALTEDGSLYSLQDYRFEWQVDGSDSSSSSEPSSDPSSDASSSAIAGSSPEEPSSSSSLAGIQAQTEPAQQERARGTLSVRNHNVQAGTFDIIVSGVSNSSGVKAVKIPVWTEENGRDDLRWYTASRQADGTYKLTINKSNHKNGQGTYHIHLYYEDNAGKTIGVATTTTSLRAAGSLSVTNVNAEAGTFDILITSVSSPQVIQSVKVPVWTTDKGQDDIKWYTASRQADGSYKVSINKKNHKNGSGEYNVHLYYQYQSGQIQGITATKTNLLPLSKGTVSTANHNLRTGTFDVIVSNVTNAASIRSVKVPVWTEEGGQDDLRWYTASRQADGTYKVTVRKSNHKNGLGLYQVHLYFEYTNGRTTGIGSTRTALSNQGSLTISNVNQEKGSFDVVISNLVTPTGIKSVKVPVWTEENGQDDIRWYTATKQSDGSYKVSVQKANHKNGLGTYQVHLYYETMDGKTVGITASKVTLVAKSTGQLSITNINRQTGSFDIVVSKVVASSPLKSVQIPVWTEENGQDDIKWYTAKQQADGSYRVTVQNKDHKNGRGTYHVHLYYQYTNGKTEGITATKTSLPEVAAAAKLRIANKNTVTGRFDVVISDIVSPKGLVKVQVPVWSEKNGQDDIRWYEATKQADGTYKVSVEASQHKYDTGTYQVHLYLTQKDGSSIGVASTKTDVVISQNQPQAKVEIKNVDNTYGLFEVLVSQVFAPAGVSKIQVPVWSEQNGQDDIRWYEAVKQADGTYSVTVRLANHKYDKGTYNAHVYLESKGQRYGLATLKTSVSYTQKSGNAFVDVSSHNGQLSVADYRKLIAQGVSGVVVKLTEGTSYLNPLAEGQIKNAQAVGLRVSVYHYSHFTSAASAQAEARYFIAAAEKLGLPKTTLMVNDIEEDKTRNNINANMKSWEAEMKRLGYHNLIHYTGASWIDVNNLGYSGPIQTKQFGISNFWVAQYPYVNGMPADQARSMSYHAAAAAWQFTSRAALLIGRNYFDLNIDYTGRFTN